MIMASPAASHRPAWVTARMAGALVIVAGAVANSLDKPHRSPFDVVLWTAGLGLGLYACVLVASALASRPLSSRTLLRLEALGLLIALTVAVWAAVTAALSGQWADAAASALLAALNVGLLWLVSRQLRALPLHS
jgi:hypothetical protein